ncbi:MAG: hypothetical protein Kow0074_17290 [Candidatus Zixiibacteriota bacterium]
MRSLKTLTTIAALVLIMLAGGCSTDGGGPMGPGDDTVAPTPQKYYDVTIMLHRFYVAGDCDGGALKDDGELSYGIEILRETAPGSGIYKHVKYVDAKDYPKSSGTKYKRSDGENLNLKQEVFVGRLEEGCNYKLKASAIEWDGVGNKKKDSRMGGTPAQEIDRTGGKAHYEHKLVIGDSESCKLYLYFDSDEVLVK